MDYDDNDFQSPNLHLAGEGNNKFPPILRPYALPRFDFDDNLHGHLRFDSLAETEAFLGIESSEDTQWIEDFSRGSTGIAFSSSGPEPSSISRRNNVWSEAASSESVEMLLKSVGQDESILGKTIGKDLDSCDELGGIIKQMEPSLKHRDGGDGLQPASQAGELPEKFSGLKGDASGDHLMVDGGSQTHELDHSVDGALKAPNMRNTNLSERDESNDDEQIVVNADQVGSSVDQFLDNREQVVNFASGSQIDITFPSVESTCATTKDSDDGDELGGIIKPEPSLKHGDSAVSEVRDALRPALLTGEIPGNFSGLKDDVSGDHLLVQDVSRRHDLNPSVDGSLKVANMKSTDLTKRDESKDGEQIVFNENQVDDSVDQFVENGEQVDKFASGSQVDTGILPVKNTCANLIENAVASVTSHAHKDSALDMQSKEDGHAIGNITARTVGEPSDRILKENPDFPIVEGCSEGLGVKSPTGISKDTVLSVGKLHDITPMPFVGDTTLKDKESVISNADTQISVSRESKLENLDSMVLIACNAVEKRDLSESGCHSITNILSSKSEKYLLSVEDGKGSKGEGDGAHNTLEAEPMRVDEAFVLTEHTDVDKFDQSVSAAENQNSKLASDCSRTDCVEVGSPIVMKGVVSSSETGDTANELASNLQSDDVAICDKSVDCGLLPSGKRLPASVVFDQKEVQVSSTGASFSIRKTSGITTDDGTSCEIGGQSSGKKVDQSLLMEDASNAFGQSGDRALRSVTLEAVKHVHASSIVSDSIVRESDGAEAQVISKKGSSGLSGDVSIQEKNKTITNSVPSTSKELSLPEDGDPKLLSEEISVHTVVHHVDGDNAKTHNSSFPSESSSKIHLVECGNSSTDLDNPSCGSPSLIRTSEQPESKIGMHTVKGSNDLSASVSGVINGEANKELPISQDTKGNGVSSGDKSFTFEVPPLENLSEKAGRNWQPFSTVQHDKISSAVKGTPLTPGLTEVGPKTAEKVSHVNLQASEGENVCGGSKGASERRTRRAGSKSAEKESAKKRNAVKDMTPPRRSQKSGRKSNASLSTAEIGQLVKSNEMQYFGHREGGNMKPSGVIFTSVSSLPDLKTSASSSAVSHQHFSDLQLVQLRAQIFVYGALIQRMAPDEGHMVSAFGGPDGGRTMWENVWRAYMDRVHCQKSHLVPPEIPLQAPIGAKTPDQSITQNALQTKIISSPASQSNSRGTPTTIGKPMVPLSSPLWTIPTPSGDPLQPTRNFVGHNAPWMSQSPFRGPWVPQNSDSNANFPKLPITEAVNLNPVKEASVSNSSAVKQVSTASMGQSGSPPNVFAGTPFIDNNKVALRPGQNSADPKPRKRKKYTAPHLLSIMRSEMALADSHASTPAAITTPPTTIVSKLPTEKSSTSVSADHPEKGDRNSDQKDTLSEDTLGKLKEAQKQAEDAAALATAAVSHSQEIWNQLDKQQNSGLAPDVENKLTSAAVAIAAAAAVAKAAAAAADVASNAALQAKLMADEAFFSSGYRNPSLITSDSAKNLGKATSASILRGEHATTSTNSVIVAAKEASRRRVEAASAASKRAENMDAIVKAAELAAEAVSQAGKIVMGEPFPLTDLVKAGPEAYWKVPHPSPEPDDAIREHVDKGGNVKAPDSFVEHSQEVPVDKNENLSNNHEMSPILQEMASESMQDDSRLTDGILGPAATSGNDKKGEKGHKASDIAKSKRVPTNTEHGKATETSKDDNMREGSHVEVLRDGGGSKVAWFLADILDLKDGKAHVCYNELQSEDGDRLKEWVELEGEGDRAPRIRSARPITAMPFERTRKRRRAAMGDCNWSVGDRVDSWVQDSWWEGVITEKSKKDETSFTVHFPAHGETSVVKSWLLRPSLMWKNGNWVEWSNSEDNNGSSYEGDTPLEKRPRIDSPVVETEEEVTKNFDNKEPEKPYDTRLLDLSAGENIFNIGKCTGDESKPGSLRTKRSGLKKEGSRVIFGVPEPGKKRKFMDVSKHYIADHSSKTRRTNDSAKFPKGSEPCRTKNKIESKENRMTVSRPKVPKSGKPAGISSRTIPQKDSLSSNVGSVLDATADSENMSEKHNLESRSVSSSDEAAEGPVLFSSAALSSDAPSEKASASNAKSGRISKGKLALAPWKSAKVDEEMRTTSEASEPRRSNRKIQPTSRLLEGLQSSLIISKVPVSHDKGHKGQNRSARGNDQD